MLLIRSEHKHLNNIFTIHYLFLITLFHNNSSQSKNVLHHPKENPNRKPQSNPSAFSTNFLPKCYNSRSKQKHKKISNKNNNSLQKIWGAPLFHTLYITTKCKKEKNFFWGFIEQVVIRTQKNQFISFFSII